MNVSILGKRLLESLIAAEMRHEAKFDLRIIRAEQCPAFFWYECLPNLLSLFGASRDVLQVRVAARQPTCRSYRLVERRMHPTRSWIHKLRQGIDIGSFQFADLSMFHHHSRKPCRGMTQLGQLFQRILIGARLVGEVGALPYGELEFIKKDFATAWVKRC